MINGCGANSHLQKKKFKEVLIGGERFRPAKIRLEAACRGCEEASLNTLQNTNANDTNSAVTEAEEILRSSALYEVPAFAGATPLVGFLGN